jgi:hypothetical protein
LGETIGIPFSTHRIRLAFDSAVKFRIKGDTMSKQMLFVALGILLGLALATTVLAEDPFPGTWKLNVAKSQFNPPSSAVKSILVKIEAQENGLKFIFDVVDAAGKSTHYEEAPKFDGKDYAVKGDPETDTVALKRMGANGFEVLNKKGGKETNRVKVVFSKDGKSSTCTTITKDAKGQELTAISIYEKQ